MDETIYLSVAEFAEAAGVTKQAIYKRLEGDLGHYAKEISGKKVINSTGLELFPFTATKSPQKRQTESQDKQSLAYLLGQLDAKDRVIATQTAKIDELQKQIIELNKHLIEQSSKITDALQEQSKLQENLHILLARQLAPIEQPQTVNEPLIEVEPQTEQPPKAEKPRKRWKLFGFIL